MRLEFSAYVEADLDDIAAYIAADNPRRAVRFIDEITALFTVIADHPQLNGSARRSGRMCAWLPMATTSPCSAFWATP